MTDYPQFSREMMLDELDKQGIKENATLRTQLAEATEHYDLAPHYGCTCKLCRALFGLAEAQEKIVYLAERLCEEDLSKLSPDVEP